MIYDDGVNMNSDLKVVVCPKCDNEVLSIDAEYCKICGLSLYNYCAGEKISDPDGNYPDRVEYHKNDSDARYCEKCGEPTNYYQEDLLSHWENAKDMIEVDGSETESFPPFDPSDEVPF